MKYRIALHRALFTTHHAHNITGMLYTHEIYNDTLFFWKDTTIPARTAYKNAVTIWFDFFAFNFAVAGCKNNAVMLTATIDDFRGNIVLN